MMVGHAMLAFAVATAVAARRWPTERALAFGALAGAFATIPDVDMLYALVGLARVGPAGVWTMTAAFWGSSHVVHRAVTHSLVVAPLAATAFAGSVTVRGTGGALAAISRPVAGLLVAGLVAVAFAASGAVGGAVMLAFLLAGLAVAAVAARRTDLGPRAVLVAALFGLASHPFGDLFTGGPPQFLYPLGVRVVTQRIVPFADPTLDLLAVFGLELATMWLAAAVYLRVTDRSPTAHVHSRAAAGIAYAIAAVAMPAPTMQVSYHFVFSILAVGTVGIAPRFHPSRRLRSAEFDDALTWLLTGLAAITVAGLAYTLVYLAAGVAAPA